SPSSPTPIRLLATTHLATFTTSSISALSTTLVCGLSAPPLSALFPYTTLFRSATQVGGLSATQIGGLTATQLRGLTTTDFAEITTTQIGGFTETQVGALSRTNLS